MRTFRYDLPRDLSRRVAPIGVAIALGGPLLGGAPALAQAEDPLVYEVKMSDDGKIAELKLVRTADGEVLAIGYPYGRPSLAELAQTPQQLSREEFDLLVEENAQPADNPTSSGYTTGLSIGYNPVGPGGGIPPGAVVGSECYNFSTAEPSSSSTDFNFDSTTSISSFSQAINASASAQGAYGQLTASDNASYSDQYKSSTNSGSAYFSASALYALSNTVATGSEVAGETNNVSNTSSLTAYGKQQAGDDEFIQSCGSHFMAEVYAGMVVTGALTWSSDSVEQSEKFSDKFSASDVGLGSLSVAVSDAMSVSDATYSCGFQIQFSGGGEYTSNIATTLADYADCLAYCCGGDQGTCSNDDTPTGACDTWSSKVDASINTAVSSFDSAEGSIAWGGGVDLGDWDTFPEGVANVPTSNSLTLDPVDTLGISDLDPDNDLQWYTLNLQYQLSLANEVRTLANRADHLMDLLGNDSFNPTSPDLKGTLGQLQTRYEDDAADLLKPVDDCLADVECSDLITTPQNAWDYYYNSGYFLLQNTIALQYKGKHTSKHNKTWPSDVMYIYDLPSFTGEDKLEPIEGKAAFVDFADMPYHTSDGTKTSARVDILPLWKTTPLNEIYNEGTDFGVYIRPSSDYQDKPGLYYGIKGNEAGDGTNNDEMTWTDPTCYPSIDSPCGIAYQIKHGQNDYPKGFQGDSISDFFTPSGGETSPQLSYGYAKVGAQGNGSSLRLSGEFPLSKAIDLRSASMSIDFMLLERGRGGTGGKGELVSDTQGRRITPIVLAPRPGARPHRALFKTPGGAKPQPIMLAPRPRARPHRALFKTRGGAKPRLQVDMEISEKHGRSENASVAQINVRLTGGSIAVPSACTENGAMVELVTRIVVGSGDGSPLTLITRNPWECQRMPNDIWVLRAQNASGL